MKAKELRELSDEDLVQKLAQLRREQYDLENAIKLSQATKDRHLIPQNRKEIARILTIQTERGNSNAS